MENNQAQILCPNCGSNQISVTKSGFDTQKALIGDALVGSIGLLAGSIGSDNTVLTCLTCGNVFYPEIIASENKKQENIAAVSATAKILNAAENSKKEKETQAKEEFEAIISVFMFFAGAAILGYLIYRKFFML